MNNIGEAGIGLWDEQDEFYYDIPTFRMGTPFR